MPPVVSAPSAILAHPPHGLTCGEALLESALTTTGTVFPSADFHRWFAARRRPDRWQITRIDFAGLSDWEFDRDTGNLRHRSGRFFSVEGLVVETNYGPVSQWAQPIISQPEIGILGILVKRIGGVLHCLMQAKMEPGNFPELQLSPTVQATRSNYTRVHKGSSIPYLEFFAGPRRGRVLVDVLQSEQGQWFHQKRNRNMVVEITEDIPLLDDFCWLTLGQLRKLLTNDDLLNMCTRTVLSCMSFTGPGLASTDGGTGHLSFAKAVAATLSGLGESVHSTFDVLSWLTEAKTRYSLAARRVPLATISGWHRTDHEIARADGRFFKVNAVSVQARTREVRRWTQPMLEPVGQGIVGFLAKRVSGAVHVLVQARLEPGYLDAIEIGATVHYLPGAQLSGGAEERPRFLDEILSAAPGQVRFDAIQSEEGGRFYHARNRYMIVEAAPDFGVTVPDDYCWVSVHQLAGLLAHSRYLNVEARTLVACLNSLW
jgi:dTDP-4-dehydro-6-deoxy-alpha-D-glucopyranose 2,3-dehydratase